MTEHLSWLCSDVAAEDDEEDAADPEEKESSCDLITRFVGSIEKSHFCGSLNPKWIINQTPILDAAYPIPWR